MYEVVLWLTLWFIVFGGYLLFERRGMNLLSAPYVSAAYFFMTSFFLILSFQEELSEFVTPIYGVLFFCTNIGVLMSFYLIRKTFPEPSVFQQNPKMFYLKLDYPYILAKAFQILFQTLMITLLIVWMLENTLTILQIIFLFAAIFGLAHIYEMYRLGKNFGAYVTLSAVLSASIFPLLVIYYGPMYAYIAHWAYYVMSALYFWMRGDA